MEPVIIAVLLAASAGVAGIVGRRARRIVAMPVDDVRRNVMASLALAVLLGSNAVKALRTRHLWTLTCYECQACQPVCPRGLDPARFVVAARTNNPDLPSQVDGTHDVPVRDAARLCVRCGLCEQKCPLRLPIMSAIDDLKNDGRFV